MTESQADFGVILDAHTVRFERWLPGSMDRVWAYLTQPELLRTWLAGAGVQPKMGGSVELRFAEADLTDFQPDDCICRGNITRFDPPRTLAYTWKEGEKQESEVSFELAPEGDGVRLTLTHRRAPKSELAGFCGGWHIHLTALASRLKGKLPGPFMVAYRAVAPHYQKKVAELPSGE